MDITTALGGGGAKCYAQIGVLRVLEEKGYRVRAMAATSAGGFLAAFYAAGFDLDAITKIFSSIDFQKILKRQRLEGPSIYGLNGLRTHLAPFLGAFTFDDLQFPLGLTAVDIDSFSPFEITSGSLLDGLMAAVAIPGLFPPQLVGGRRLVDGGTTNPVPVTFARRLNPGIPAAAIILAPRLERWGDHPFPKLVNTVPKFRFLMRFNWIRALDLFIRANDLTNRMFTESQLQIQAPDIVLRVEVPPLGIIDPTTPEKIIALGAVAAEKALQDATGNGHWNGVTTQEKELILNNSSGKPHVS